MPAYSYKERFVPLILDGSKPFTIRNPRRFKTKVGDTLYHYYAMRTKFCKKLVEDKCLDTDTILITKSGQVMVSKVVLSQSEKDRLAWLDGFRIEGSTLRNCEGCFGLMLRWWKQTNGLPFKGDIIMRSAIIYNYKTIAGLLTIE